MTWDLVFEVDFPNINLIIDLVQSLPPTSVSCETSFSQMKLTKTARRLNFKDTTLNRIMQAKLLSPDVGGFDPNPAIDYWLVNTYANNLF
ncbi:hypothetical protein DPMN_151658 [Dreissena polymorpha]|uniref:HAT C-terminal dimerisation domain-containing protein n=1 Tax=Dreissena polymorpha TaxID=45954 RepID=A0A9D4FFS0_DREPO|nr:hypothetical protein DPMN_151658 [Dreissena polymorpha]